MKNVVIALVLLGVAIAAAAVIFVSQGVFEVAADVPHSAIVLRLMETTRDRAIAVRAKDIRVPPLDNPVLIAKGASDYSEMCSGCHLAPGQQASELRRGLYPQPPDLTQGVDASPAELFWIVKHGIKMSGMPAWGLTHDDQRIWDIVAFLRKLPELSPDQYQALVNANPAGHHHDDSEGPAEREHRAHTRQDREGKEHP